MTCSTPVKIIAVVDCDLQYTRQIIAVVDCDLQYTRQIIAVVDCCRAAPSLPRTGCCAFSPGAKELYPPRHVPSQWTGGAGESVLES